MSVPYKTREQWARTVKLVLLGDAATGKTSLVNRFCSDRFTIHYTPTPGLEVVEKVVKLPGNIPCLIQIWDVAGTMLTSRGLASALHDADAVLLVYDVTIPSTFKAIRQWLTMVEAICGDASVQGLGMAGRARPGAADALVHHHFHHRTGNAGGVAGVGVAAVGATLVSSAVGVGVGGVGNSGNNGNKSVGARTRVPLVCLVGTKTDATNLRMVTPQQHLLLVDEFDLLSYFTSARVAETVYTMFLEIAGRLLGVARDEVQVKTIARRLSAASLVQLSGMGKRKRNQMVRQCVIQ
ncbi:Ras- protein Rab-28 [Allomyces javanicus]|nr:Ras- protein Rab-28 [Allomyces javanicus]